MDKKQIVLGIIALWVSIPVWGREITIEECYRKAQANYPLIKQYDLIEKSREYSVSNANKGYLPQISFSAKASYQSDVTKLPFNFSRLGISGVEIPTLSKDQYGATVDITQTIWDGGATRFRKDDIRMSAEVEKKNTEVALYKVNERVNQIFFGILLADAQIRQNKLYQEELERNYRQIESYIANGVGNQSDLDAVKINRLKAEQSRIQFVSTRKAYVEMLSRLVGEPIGDDVEFVKPAVLRAGGEVNRLELQLYDSQIRHLQVKDKEIVSGLMPKFGLFFTGGYGKPGLNMLEDDFAAYYVAGVKLSWNMGNFYTRRNSKRQLRDNVRAVELQRETFLFNLDLDMTQKNNEIEKYVKQLRYDDEIIALRNSVKEASVAKVANGTLSGTDFMRDVNAEQLAVQDKIFHEIELLLAMYDLKYITNN